MNSSFATLLEVLISFYREGSWGIGGLNILCYTEVSSKTVNRTQISHRTQISPA